MEASASSLFQPERSRDELFCSCYASDAFFLFLLLLVLHHLLPILIQKPLSSWVFWPSLEEVPSLLLPLLFLLLFWTPLAFWALRPF